MIELLIVIGVLGILAVGVLAAIDPFEQLKKARDTNTRQSVISLHTAFTRYFATHNALPWDNAVSTCVGFATTRAVGMPIVVGNAMEACVNAVIAEGELKTGFITALGTTVAGGIYVSSPAIATVNVCFAPASKSIFQEVSTKFDESGVDQSVLGSPTCTAARKVAGTDVVGDCFYCAK